MKQTLGNRHVDEHETAQFLGQQVSTVRDWRVRKIGPPYCKFGRSVRYSVDELIRFAAESKVETTPRSV